MSASGDPGGGRPAGTGTSSDTLGPLAAGEDAFFADLSSALASRSRRRGHLDGFRPAAVLLPLVRRAQTLYMTFLCRVEDGSIHSGQVAFPGGAREAEDADLGATALREAEEEVGIPASSVRLLGALDDSATISRYVVTPMVGVVEPPPVYRLDPGEVQEVFEVPLAFLLDPANERRVEDIEFLGHRWPLYEYRFQGKLIWGATGRILCDFLTLARSLPTTGALCADAGAADSPPEAP